MSIIFGAIEPTRIVICSDKRYSSKDGSLINDDADKIQVMNKHLAVASAGNAAIEKVVEIESRKLNSSEMTVDTILSILKEFYSKVDNQEALFIKSLPYCALIAGKTHNGDHDLISLSYFHGKLSYQRVSYGLFGYI